MKLAFMKHPIVLAENWFETGLNESTLFESVRTKINLRSDMNVLATALPEPAGKGYSFVAPPDRVIIFCGATA